MQLLLEIARNGCIEAKFAALDSFRDMHLEKLTAKEKAELVKIVDQLLNQLESEIEKTILLELKKQLEKS